MNRETRNTMKALKSSLVDFFYVYFDEATSKKIRNHPEMAIPMIREEISIGIASRSRVAIYAAALRDAVEYQRLALTGGTGPR